MLYRIYVGSFDYTSAQQILLQNGIDSFSAVAQYGCWKGDAEQSLIIEIFDLNGDLEGKIRAVSEVIRAASGQEAVYIVSMPVEAVKAITV